MSIENVIAVENDVFMIRKRYFVVPLPDGDVLLKGYSNPFGGVPHIGNGGPPPKNR